MDCCIVSDGMAVFLHFTVGTASSTSLGFFVLLLVVPQRNIYHKMNTELSCLVTDRDVVGVVPYKLTDFIAYFIPGIALL